MEKQSTYIVDTLTAFTFVDGDVDTQWYTDNIYTWFLVQLEKEHGDDKKDLQVFASHAVRRVQCRKRRYWFGNPTAPYKKIVRMYLPKNNTYILKIIYERLKYLKEAPPAGTLNPSFEATT